MAYNKKTWLARLGQGLNKFSIDGATPVPIINQPDSVTQQGDALSAGNLNDLEDRIDNAFEEIADGTQVVGKATADASGNVIDQTYETKADASDLKDACSALDKRVTNLELKTGDQFEVDYPSDTYGMDGVPSNVEPYAKVKVLKGVGRIANQCVHDITSALQTANATVNSFADGVTTFTATAKRGNAYSSRNINPLPQKDGHYVLLLMDVKTTTPTTEVRLYCYGGYASKNVVSSANWQQVAVVVQVLASWGYDFNYQNYMTLEDTRDANWDAIQTRNWKCKDLTEYFNTTDLSFLGATSAEKLATIQQKYPELLTPSDYGTEVVFPTYTAVKSVGRNLWDEVWEEGDINYNTGVPQGDSNYIRSVNFCVVKANTSIYVKANNTTWLLWYDANYGYLGGTNQDGKAGGTVVTSPANARYFKLVNRKIVFDGKICINVSDSQNGTYSPYMTDTLTLPEPVTLKEAGAVSEIYYPETGRVTHPIGSVDLGTLTFVMTSTSVFRNATISEIALSAEALCPRYTKVASYPLMLNTEKSLWVGDTTKEIYIHDSAYSDATAFKASLSGVMLYYELATPSADTYVDPILDPYIKVEPNGTIKPVQSQSPEVDSAMTVEYMAS